MIIINLIMIKIISHMHAFNNDFGSHLISRRLPDASFSITIIIMSLPIVLPTISLLNIRH